MIIRVESLIFTSWEVILAFPAEPHPYSGRLLSELEMLYRNEREAWRGGGAMPAEPERVWFQFALGFEIRVAEEHRDYILDLDSGKILIRIFDNPEAIPKILVQGDVLKSIQDKAAGAFIAWRRGWLLIYKPQRVGKPHPGK